MKADKISFSTYRSIGISVVGCAQVDRGINSAGRSIPVEPDGADAEDAARAKASSIQTRDYNVVRVRREPGARKNLDIVAPDGKDIKELVGRCGSHDAIPLHRGVVFVQLPLAVGVVRAGVVLAQEGCGKVVKVGTAAPVGAQAADVVPFELRQVVRRGGRGLLVGPRVLVEVGRAEWKPAVLGAQSIEVGHGRVGLPLPRPDLVPRVDIRDDVVVGHVLAPGLPVCVVEGGCVGHGWATDGEVWESLPVKN